jgi:hypothetical protein
VNNSPAHYQSWSWYVLYVGGIALLCLSSNSPDFNNHYAVLLTRARTVPFLSIRILDSWQARQVPIIHTALRSMTSRSESFLWLLIWGIVHAPKDIEGARANNNPGIQLVLDACQCQWPGDLQTRDHRATVGRMPSLAISSEKRLGIFGRARDGIRQFMKHLPTITLDNWQGSVWRRACDRLESYCMKAYQDVLKSGFDRLEDVGKCSDWKKVVAANAQAQAQAQKMIY